MMYSSTEQSEWSSLGSSWSTAFYDLLLLHKLCAQDIPDLIHREAVADDSKCIMVYIVFDLFHLVTVTPMNTCYHFPTSLEFRITNCFSGKVGALLFSISIPFGDLVLV